MSGRLELGVQAETGERLGDRTEINRSAEI
jgi:hypothetical protein